MSKLIKLDSYRTLSIKIIALVVLSTIIIAMGVVLAFRVRDTMVDQNVEYLWFKIEAREAELDATAVVYISSDNGTILEQLFLYNTTIWQHSANQYRLSSYVKIDIKFWFLDLDFENVTYMIGKNPIMISTVSVSIIIVSNVEMPLF